MLGGGARDARRTELYLDGLMEAEERGADAVPIDLDLDPAVLLASRELRAGLVRVHPSFRYEEGLAARLAQTAARMSGPAPVPAFGPAPAARPAVDGAPDAVAARDGTTLPDAAHRRGHAPSRPLMVGGVGVASAALSLGAVYVAWRWSRSARPPMVRAARAARSGRRSSAAGRRAGVLHGILG